MFLSGNQLLFEVHGLENDGELKIDLTRTNSRFEFKVRACRDVITTVFSSENNKAVEIVIGKASALLVFV